MKNLQILFLSFSLILIASCGRPFEDIVGYWEVTYPDTVAYAKQILHFSVKAGKLELAIDEPLDGTLGIPGEKVMFSDDSVYFESLWGLFSYCGSFVSGDTLIHGERRVNNTYPLPFVMRRIAELELTYKIPRVDERGERLMNYTYSAPQPGKDGLLCSSLEETGIDPVPIQKLVKDVLSGKMSTIHSLLLMKDNKMVLEEYFHNYDKNTVHRLESVTKSFTSALMGIAIDKGFVPGINEPVSSYLRQWDSTRWMHENYDIRIEHLLTMTSGLAWKGFTPNESNDDVDIYVSPDYIEYILDKEQQFRPGEHFYYNNRLMYLQGHIIEESSGLSVDSFASKYLFNELGIETHDWTRYDNGIYETGGGLKLCPRDMLKFGMLYLNGGYWKDKEIISPEWISKSTTSQASAGNMDYGYNWWINAYQFGGRTYTVFLAMGHGEQTIMAIPEKNAVFVMTAGNFFQVPQRLDEIMLKYILPALEGEISMEKDIQALNLDAVAGEYEINLEESILIELKDSVLYAVDPSGEWMELIEKEPGYYMVGNTPREVRIISDNEGNVLRAEVIVNGEVLERLKKIK